MNTYSKLCPNVFLAKCTEKHEKGETIDVETRYGKVNESIVFNLIFEKDGYFYYSIVRADGFNTQERARRRADKLQTAAENADKKSAEYYNRSHNLVKDIPLGQPILVGHYSERAHRRVLDKSWNAMDKSVELSKKATDCKSRASYWEDKAETVNLSMPESVEYYEYLLEKASKMHAGLKDGTIERKHSYSLIYAKKEVNELEKKLTLARKLWE